MKIHMPGSIDKVQHIGLALVPVIHRNRRGLDGYSSFTLEIHIVKKLFGLLTVRNRAGQLEHTVGQRALAVVNMRYNRKISYMFSTHQICFQRT